MKNLIMMLLIVCFCSPSSACANPRVYAGPWSGQVIDSETKQPIEGAAVVAIWLKSHRTLAGPKNSYLDTAETMTDKEGKFLLPSKKFLNIPFVREIEAPNFYIFKPGYGCYPEYMVSPKVKFLKGFFEKPTVIELPRITDIKKRTDVFSCVESTQYRIPEKDHDKINYFIQLRNEEAKTLGYPLIKE